MPVLPLHLGSCNKNVCFCRKLGVIKSGFGAESHWSRAFIAPSAPKVRLDGGTKSRRCISRLTRVVLVAFKDATAWLRGILGYKSPAPGRFRDFACFHFQLYPTQAPPNRKISFGNCSILLRSASGRGFEAKSEGCGRGWPEAETPQRNGRRVRGVALPHATAVIKSKRGDEPGAIPDWF
jgi:hypothetical protein